MAATLTSTGINCSNGTLDGLYTGTTRNNSTFPIGSYVATNYSFTGVQMLYPNETNTVYSPGTGTYAQNFSNNAGGPGSVACAGTWRSRGQCADSYGGSTYFYLFQRVA